MAMSVKKMAFIERALWWSFWVGSVLVTLFSGLGFWMRREHLVFNDSTCEPIGLYKLLGSPFPLQDENSSRW